MGALERLIESYGDSVYKLVCAIIRESGGAADIEECCSDVFADAWEKRSLYNPARGSLRTWVLILARYKALDYRRQLLRRREKEVAGAAASAPFPVEESSGSGDHPESRLIEDESRREVAAALASLPAPEKEILYRRYYLEESVAEIASALGISRGAAENRLWRARKNLKSILDVEQCK